MPEKKKTRNKKQIGLKHGPNPKEKTPISQRMASAFPCVDPISTGT